MSRSAMQNHFARVPSAEIPRSKFKRDHGFKATMDAGLLVPIFVDEVLPGDTFNLKEHLFGRLNTPIVPFMDNLYLDTFYFFVPNRLVWDNWQKFNGEQRNPGDSTDYSIPKVQAPMAGFSNSSLWDYFGIPTGVQQLEVNALHSRAYNLIWNEWFRDQNLQNTVVVDTDDGPDTYTDYVLKRRGKRHDYFTSCLPFPQKGPAVTLPLGQRAPISGIGKLNDNFTAGSATVTEPWRPSQTAEVTYVSSQYIGSTADTNFYVENDPAHPGYPLIYADLADATSATINQLREAFQVQRLYERDARGGTRYTEILRAHFGVISPDARLQRPEYLGGGSNPININPVAQNSATTDDSTPQANLAAFGTVSSGGRGFSKSFTEHGVIIGLASVRADLNYQQGLNKMWSRNTRFDYYWPALSHLGEQAVLNKEIYCVGNAGTTDNEVFGYQERYAEYRYKPSLITSQFRSNYAQSLDIWHLAQEFGALPALNASFIEENPPVDRVVATPDEPHLKLDCYFQLTCARPMPMYSVPGMIDHF